jgi:hypothetical protein
MAVARQEPTIGVESREWLHSGSSSLARVEVNGSGKAGAYHYSGVPRVSPLW